MNCNEYRRLASARIDGQIASDESRVLAAHLASCPACDRADRAMRAVDAGFSSRLGHSVPPGFKSALFERLEAEALLPPRKGRLLSFPLWRWAAMPLAAAAGLLLILLVGREAGEMRPALPQLARQAVPVLSAPPVDDPLPKTATDPAPPSRSSPVALSPEEADLVANLDLIEEVAALEELPAGLDEMLATPLKGKG